MLDLNALLKTLVSNGGSDLHLVAGSPPYIRVNGVLRRLKAKVLTPQDTVDTARFIIPADRRERFDNLLEADFAYSAANIGRFRVNMFRQRGSVTLVFRRVQVGSASFEDLGLPLVLGTLADSPRGLLLVTGPTGSGKTTTLAALIDHINAKKYVHILTIEDPIEVLHPPKRASVNQREVGVDTESFVHAMRSAMRQDPDVVLIGEMRDTETVAAALAAAETGHLVLSSLHTTDAVETVNRIVDFFPATSQRQVRISLASSLRGVVCQRLVPRIGGGRVPVCEVLVNNGRVADRIIDPDLTSEIRDIISDGEYYGMQTFDNNLVELVERKLVSMEDAVEASSSPHDIRLKFEQAGLKVPA